MPGDAIAVSGTVAQSMPNALFRVNLDNGHRVVAHLSGAMRMRYIRIVPGDKVRVELSPLDLSRRRITYRMRCHEGTGRREGNLQEVQGDPTPGGGACAVHEPPAQTATRIGKGHGTHRRCRPAAQQAYGNRADLHLRYRPERGPQHLRRGAGGAGPEERRPERWRDHPYTSRDRCWGQGRGRPPPRRGQWHQAPGGSRLLSGAAAPTQPPRAWPAHPYERPDAKGTAASDRGEEARAAQDLGA